MPPGWEGGKPTTLLTRREEEPTACILRPQKEAVPLRKNRMLDRTHLPAARTLVGKVQDRGIGARVGWALTGAA
jgi:hypothetical protein